MNRESIAISYAKSGINIIPCDPSTKSPLTKNGHADATSDEKIIKQWWTEHPDALIGGVCDQFTVVDIDDYCVPSLARTVIDGVLADLKNSGVFSDQSFKVRTKSGGTHYYFKNRLQGRMLNFLPSIDVLGDSGYSILPDQKDYVCETSSTPWDSISSLEELNIDGLWSIRPKYEDVLKDIKDLIKSHRKANGFVKPRKTSKRKSKTVSRTKKTPSDKKITTSSYNDKPEFEIKNGLYARSEVEDKCDPYAKLLDDEGTIHVDEGMLNSSMINALFHNREVQIKIAKHLGLVIPSNGKGSSMRSPLPGHIDNNPSFGVRWSEDESHLICRDFSNHFADKYNQTDYNLVRLFAVLRYGVNVPRLSKSEFVTWFLRLLHDSDIMNVDHLKKEFFDSELKGFTVKQKQIIEHFQLLDAVKRTYEGYEGRTVMSQNFGYAWCGVAKQTFITGIDRARERGLAVWVSNYQGKAGMRATKVYRVGTDAPSDNYDHTTPEDDMKINEAFQNVKPKTTPFKTDAQKEKERMEKHMSEKYGKDIRTMIAIKIGTGIHEKITTFCEDFGIEGVASKDVMVLPLMIKKGYTEVDLKRDQVDSTWYVPTSGIRFFVDDGDFGNSILIAEFESKELGDLAEMYISNYDKDKVDEFEGENEIFDFVISNDIDPEVFDNVEMLNKLALGFPAYVSTLSFDKQVSGIMGESEILKVFNGIDPAQDMEM